MFWKMRNKSWTCWRSLTNIVLFKAFGKICIVLTSCWYGMYIGKHCKVLAVQIEMKVKN